MHVDCPTHVAASDRNEADQPENAVSTPGSYAIFDRPGARIRLKSETNLKKKTNLTGSHPCGALGCSIRLPLGGKRILQ